MKESKEVIDCAWIFKIIVPVNYKCEKGVVIFDFSEKMINFATQE